MKSTGQWQTIRHLGTRVTTTLGATILASPTVGWRYASRPPSTSAPTRATATRRPTKRHTASSAVPSLSATSACGATGGSREPTTRAATTPTSWGRGASGLLSPCARTGGRRSVQSATQVSAKKVHYRTSCRAPLPRVQGHGGGPPRRCLGLCSARSPRTATGRVSKRGQRRDALPSSRCARCGSGAACRSPSAMACPHRRTCC